MLQGHSTQTTQQEPPLSNDPLKVALFLFFLPDSIMQLRVFSFHITAKQFLDRPQNISVFVYF